MTANMALLSPATAGTAAVAAAAAAAINRPGTQVVSSSLSPPSDSIKSARASLLLSPLPRTAAAVASIAANTSRTRKWKVSCEVALKSDAKPSSSSSSSSSSSAETGSPSVSGEGDGPDGGSARIGARVRVKVPLKVYHVPRVPEVDLTGMEGELKQYVADFKGKRISANLPCKVQFVKEIEGRGPVKFFAHLKEDEFEYV
ncbi:ferredoxin-thioredoxin reductase subunit A1, chloroplastic-like isoform X2 [Syzygium oleosum]|uniref:ferredoxin-thioredoxin reductase subunit A1, chloroplastic-like isoform X2 n=1 Tax=Syzygium oleosum TaxID=219896 RepID=UPI0011D1B971|nr:ferredoxin-thioredoxin reductase subunit A1, chloroplastic-like isoform X2 [Syzygium oleosum]